MNISLILDDVDFFFFIFWMFLDIYFVLDVWIFGFGYIISFSVF